MNIYDLNKTAWDRAVGEGTNPFFDSKWVTNATGAISSPCQGED
jgi:hypothetical protein